MIDWSSWVLGIGIPWAGSLYLAWLCGRFDRGLYDILKVLDRIALRKSPPRLRVVKGGRAQ